MATNTMKGTQAFQDTIAQYLMTRAENDPLVAVRLANPSKTMEQCCAYIIGEVKKSGCCGFTDDEIFGWAMHFWDEPEIEVSNTAKLPSGSKPYGRTDRGRKGTGTAGRHQQTP